MGEEEPSCGLSAGLGQSFDHFKDVGHILSRFLFSHSRPVPTTASHLAQVLNRPLPGNPSTSRLLLNHVVAKLWIESGQSENSKHCLLEPALSTWQPHTLLPLLGKCLPSLVSNQSISPSEVCGHHGHWAQDWAQSLSWGSRFNETLTARCYCVFLRNHLYDRTLGSQLP